MGAFTYWTCKAGNLMLQLKKHSGSVNAIAFSLEGNLLASGAMIVRDYLGDRHGQTATPPFKGHDLAVTCLASHRWQFARHRRRQFFVSYGMCQPGSSNRVLK